MLVGEILQSTKIVNLFSRPLNHSINHESVITNKLCTRILNL